MANQKITDLDLLTDLASGDLFVAVDISDTSSPTGETKRIEALGLATGIMDVLQGEIDAGNISDIGLSVWSLLDTPSSASANDPANEGKALKLLGGEIIFDEAGSPASSITIDASEFDSGITPEAGMVIRRTETGGTYTTSSADNIITAEAIGVITSVNGSDIKITFSGYTQFDTPIFQQGTLTDGCVYFLGETGSLSITDGPDINPSYISKPILVGISSDEAIVVNYRGYRAPDVTQIRNKICTKIDFEGHAFDVGDVVRKLTDEQKAEFNQAECAQINPKAGLVPDWVLSDASEFDHAHVAGIVSEIGEDFFILQNVGMVDLGAGANLEVGKNYYLRDKSDIDLSELPTRNVTLDDPNCDNASKFSKPVYYAITSQKAVLLQARTMPYCADNVDVVRTGGGGINLMADSGRFGGVAAPSIQRTLTTGFVAPDKWFSPQNGSTQWIEQGKFIHNNSNNTGVAPFLATNVQDLLTKMVRPANTNSSGTGTEFYIAQTTMGSGVNFDALPGNSSFKLLCAIDSTVLGVTGYDNNVTMGFWIRAASGQFGINPANILTKVDGSAVTEVQLFDVNSGWVHIHQVDRSLTGAANSTMAGIYATQGSQIEIACPYAIAGAHNPTEVNTSPVPAAPIPVALVSGLSPSSI
jgi:hypothetical protein